MTPSAFDFDAAPDRSGTDSMKWRRVAGRDVIPLWVADMDFAAPPPVLAALQARVAHGVFGYADPWPSLVDAVVEGIARDHCWRVQPEWLVWLPGVVTGFNLACRAVGAPGDGVLTSTPVYPPFLTAPANSDRVLQAVPLAERDGRWGWDWPALEAAITTRSRLLMLCQPHNPVGRVFNRDELTRLLAVAEAHDLVVCSDEIHCGLVLEPGLEHLPFASLGEAAARRSITLMAPSKTWNIPALYCAFAIIPDPALRRAYLRQMRGIVPHVGVLGLVATEVAYREGGPWRAALLDALRGNRDWLAARVAGLPGLRMSPVEATYLAWIDCRDWLARSGVGNAAEHFEAHGVLLSDGRDFGLPGFVRLNFGCPRARLEQALARMARALTAPS